MHINIIEAEQAVDQLDQYIIIDVSSQDSKKNNHIKNAIDIDYNQITTEQPPAKGMLPPAEQIYSLFKNKGINLEQPLLIYDDTTGVVAARTLWTLACYGYQNLSFLNGGIKQWRNKNLPLTTQWREKSCDDYKISIQNQYIAHTDYILKTLTPKREDRIILDVRSIKEYTGTDKRSTRGGHIPGAIHMEWTWSIHDINNIQTIKPLEELNAMLDKSSLQKDKEIIVYCQTHQRSAHTWMVLSTMGYTNVKGYPGAWSAWGNQLDIPVET